MILQKTNLKQMTEYSINIILMNAFFSKYFQTVSISVSVLTLTVISIERWYAICYPLKFKATTSRAKRLILLIWAISLIIGKHFVILYTISAFTRIRILPEIAFSSFYLFYVHLIPISVYRSA